MNTSEVFFVMAHYSLSEVKKEMADFSELPYVRYAPCNLAMTYGHPLRLVSPKDLNEAKRILMFSYPIREEQVCTLSNNEYSCIFVLIAVVDNNEEVIQNAMSIMGYAKYPMLSKSRIDSQQRQWKLLTFVNRAD